METKKIISQKDTMRTYYQFQSTIYDATRWLFLFGRNEILELIQSKVQPKHIVEVGCGTGYNTKKLGQLFPKSKITGIDVSSDMLAIAKKKVDQYNHVTLLERPYAAGIFDKSNAPDLFLFSYSLTMINPQFEELIHQAHADLAPGGKIAVVDFHSSSQGWFRNHMSNHHVRMEAHLNPVLESLFDPVHTTVNKAYFGIWNYFLFLGEKK